MSCGRRFNPEFCCAIPKRALRIQVTINMSNSNNNDTKGGTISNMMRRHSADEAVRGGFFMRGLAGMGQRIGRERTVSEVVHETHESTPPSETSQKERRISVMSLCPI